MGLRKLKNLIGTVRRVGKAFKQARGAIQGLRTAAKGLKSARGAIRQAGKTLRGK